MRNGFPWCRDHNTVFMKRARILPDSSLVGQVILRLAMCELPRLQLPTKDKADAEACDGGNFGILSRIFAEITDHVIKRAKFLFLVTRARLSFVANVG